MYLHLGQNTVITTREIVGFFDMDNTTVSKTTRDYLSQAEKNGRVKYVSYDLPKSFIVTKDQTVYISPVSVATLMGRTQKNQSF